MKRTQMATALALGLSICSASAVNLSLGTIVSSTISAPGQQDTYTFTGSPGQRLFYDALDADFDQIQARLTNPSGLIVSINQNSDSDFGPFTLTDSGTYSLVIDGVGATVGDYSFRLVDLISQPELPLNTVLTKTLNPGYSVDWYRFTAVGGERLFFDGLGANAGGNWYFYGPNNEPLGSAGIGGDFEVILAQPGVYLLAIAGSSASPVNYSVRVLPFNIATTLLTLGATVNGNIASPGDQAVYTFTGNAGQRLFYDALDGDFDPINVRLLNPSGANVYLNQNADADFGPFTLTDTGTYSLIIDGSAATTGDYSFRLQDMASQPPLPLDTVITKSLTPGFSVDWYRFDGVTGEKLFFDGLGANVGGSWNLFGPNNELISSSGIGGDFEVILPRPGPYLVSVSGTSANPVPYSVQVVTFETTSSSLVLGTTISGTIAEPGEQDLFTFTGTAGQQLYYDALDRDFEQMNARLIPPSGGAPLWEINSSSDQGPFTLTASGVYTLVLDGLGATVGDYSFRLVDLASAPALSLTTPTISALNPRSETDIYQLNGAKGQRLSFDSLSATAVDATWRLVGPANQTLVSGGIASDLSGVTLPASSPYFLLIEGSAENVLPLNYQVQVADVSDIPVAISGLNTVLSGNLSAGQQDSSTFQAPAGALIYFDSQDRTSSGVTIDLQDPLHGLFQTVSAASDSGPFSLPYSGTYTVIAHGTGSYRFRILDLAASPALAFDTELQGNLDPGYKTDVYQFNGTPGQRFFYDALDNDFDQIFARLLAPDGSFRMNVNSDSDVAPFTLLLPGTYYLFFESVIATPADYHFRFLDATHAPVVPIDLPVTGSLTPGLGATIYRLTGTPGQLLFFDADAANNGGTWGLYGPNNDALLAAGLGGDFELTFTQPGEYLLALTSSTASPVGYNFQVVNPNAGAPTGDAPVISSITALPNAVTVNWTAVAGKTYFLQFKSSLSDPLWTDLSGAVVATGPTASKTDNPGTDATRFYQVKLAP